MQSTLLGGAAARGELNVVWLLLGRGANPSLANSRGLTPLMVAAANGHAAVVRVLAARGADLDAVEPEAGATAFHHACLSNRPECAAALVDLGCDTAIATPNGTTGQRAAEERGHAAVLERLEEATGRRRALEPERVATAQREEVGRLIARQAFGAAAPLLARMLRDAPADPGLLAWQAEVAAAQAEAEAAAEANAAALLAELEAEGSAGGSVRQSKSQKKKENHRKKKEAAMAAQPVGKRRNKKNKKKGPGPGSTAGPLDIIQPGEPEPEPAPGWDPDPAVGVVEGARARAAPGTA
jgi:hypothetical protein